MKKKLVCAVLAVSMVMTACGSSKEKAEEKETVSVDITSPEYGDISVKGEFMGTLEPEEETAVIPKMSGEVTETYFEVGDQVEAGDLLFTLDDTALQMQMANAQATYDTAAAGASQQLGGLDVQKASAENSVLSASDSIKSVTDACGNLSDSYNDVDEQLNEMEGNKDDLEDAAKRASDYYQKLATANSLLGKLKSLEAQYNASTDPDDRSKLKTEFNTYFAKITGSSGDVDPAGSHSAEYNSYIASTTGNPLITIDNLSSEMTTAKGNANSASSALSSVESGINSLESQKDSINNSKTSTASSYDQAVRGKNLAQKNLDYFNNYTAPGTQATVSATLKQASVGVESAQLQLDYTKVTAPVSGVIESISVEKYDMAQAGAPTYVITNKDNMVVNFKVTENVKNNLKVNQDVVIERNGTEYAGYISEIPLNVDAASGLFIIKAVVKQGKEQLVSGTAAKVTTQTQFSEKTLMIPIDAVYYDSSKAFTYIVKDGVVKKVYIEVGVFDDTNMEVISGISESDKVVCSWSSELRDGLEVETKEVSANSVEE